MSTSFAADSISANALLTTNVMVNRNSIVTGSQTVGGGLSVGGNMTLTGVIQGDLRVSGNINSTGVTTLSNVSASGTLGVTGNTTLSNVTATGTATISSLNAGNSILAPNFVSNQNIADSRWHLPTPTGPFAVDIIPMNAKDISLNLDMFGVGSAQYWGSVAVKDDVPVTIYAPSNRTGAAKDVSASLTGCFDPSSSIDTANGGVYPKATLVSGLGLYHPDDFAFMIAINNFTLPAAGNDDTSGTYIGWMDALSDFRTYFISKCFAYGGNNTIDSSSSVRTELLRRFNVIRQTYTYQNLYRHFSVKTGKIWYNTQGISLTNGYKDFSNATPIDNLLQYDTCKLSTTTWTSAQLPSQADIFAATGDPSGCPFIIKVAGTTSTELQHADPWHSIEMASRGFVVIVKGTSHMSTLPAFKVGTNQTFIDCLTVGYLGQGSFYDFTNKSTFPNLDFSYFTNKKNYYDFNAYSVNLPAGTPATTLNLNNAAQTNPNVWGITPVYRLNTGAAFGVTNSLNYYDENGRTPTSALVDAVNPYNAVTFHSQLTHTDGTVSSNNLVTIEKYLYTMKYITQFVGFGSNINYNNTSLTAMSAGGYSAPFFQNLITGTVGQSKYLTDQSSAKVTLFKPIQMTLFETSMGGFTVENKGRLITQTAAPMNSGTTTSYNYPNNTINYANENTTSFPNGFLIPFLLNAQTDPGLFYQSTMLDANFVGMHYALQQTRNTTSGNSNILPQSIVYYGGNKHAMVVDVQTGWSPLTNVMDGTNVEYGQFYVGGWDWPVRQAFNTTLYPNGDSNAKNGVTKIQTQLLEYDCSQRLPMQILWNLHGQAVDLTKDVNGRVLGQIHGVTLNAILDLNNYGPGKLVLGPNELEPYTHIDGLYRMVGPHKIETLRDRTANRNHLSIDFGKMTLFENNNNALELIPRPNQIASLIIDSSYTGTGSNVALVGGTNPLLKFGASSNVLSSNAMAALYSLILAANPSFIP